MDALWQFFNDDVRESAALLDARMKLYFESRHASLVVEAFVKLGARLSVPFDATRRLRVLPIPLPVACGMRLNSCGALWHGSPAPKLVREPFGSHERGARVWAAFAICFSRTEHAHHDPGLPVQR